MTDKEILVSIVDLVKQNFEPSWVSEPITSERCYGNYDDVFNDGIRLGQHYMAADILDLLKENGYYFDTN